MPSPNKFAHTYEFKFVQDWAGRPFEYAVAAFSFMQAYRWALRALRKAKGNTKARTFKLERMDRH
jgi:hypothetical protein